MVLKLGPEKVVCKNMSQKKFSLKIIGQGELLVNTYKANGIVL